MKITPLTQIKIYQADMSRSKYYILFINHPNERRLLATGCKNQLMLAPTNHPHVYNYYYAKTTREAIRIIKNLMKVRKIKCNQPRREITVVKKFNVLEVTKPILELC